MCAARIAAIVSAPSVKAAGHNYLIYIGTYTGAESKGIYAYRFDGTRYDAGDKLGFLKATVEFALNRHDLGSGSNNQVRCPVTEPRSADHWRG